MSSTPYVITQPQARELLAKVDVPQILRKLFRDLAAGQAVQPAQQLVEFPQGAGDFINYLGVLAQEPPSPDDPILDTPNLLLSPHIACYSSASELRVRRQVVDGVLRCLAGEAPATGRIALDPRVAEGG